ncbi:MAG TPA: hypothetical protein PK280_00545 [Planctomycetota bacterium]|nr:hypothetical protein [Planctomycetota bacterium]
MHRVLICALSLGLATASATAAEPAPPKFVKKPAVARAGDRTTISFAVDRETDVAVYIEDAKGTIVRHLVAGVLGKNPPEPLKANSLEQSLEWDDRDDDGKQAAGGPFKIRVGLGLSASYAGQPFAAKGQSGPDAVENVAGLACAGDGRLLVLDRGVAFEGDHFWMYKLHAFLRDGSYERTIKPFPPGTPPERAKGAFVNAYGKLNPLVHSVPKMSFYTHDEVPGQPAVLPDGRLVLAVTPGLANLSPKGGIAHLATLDADGGISSETYAGPVLRAGQGWTGFPCLAASGDGKAVYLTGLGPMDHYGPSKPTHAVYIAKLPERGPAEVFFGDPAKAGADDAHLSDPRGLAVDGKGHLLVADRGNNRVLVLNEKDRSVAGSIPVDAPFWVAVHPKTGALYVACKETSLVKLAGWDNPKELARADFASLRAKTPEPYRWSYRMMFALDPSGAAPRIWVATSSALPQGRALAGLDDQGERFSEPAPARFFMPPLFRRPAADPTRREVGTSTDNDFRILDETTGAFRTLAGLSAQGRSHRIGPDGAIYAQDHWGKGGGVCRWDRNGKPLPFAATASDPWLRGRMPYGSNGFTDWERDFSVARNGDIYVKAQGPVYHGLSTVRVYDRDGNFKRVAIHSVTEGGYGPRLDARGNLYFMEACKEPGRLWPDEFKGRLINSAHEAWIDNIYGSIVKFGPEGGALWYQSDSLSPVTYEGWGVAFEKGRPGGKKTLSELKTTGGALVGTIAQAPVWLAFPRMGIDAAAHKKVTLRLKNGTGGDKATLAWQTVSGDGREFTKSVEIKPNSDFTEYVFDLAGEAGWKGALWNLQLSPTNAASGSFQIASVRIGEADSKLAWNFDAEDSPELRLPAAMKKEKVAANHRNSAVELQGAKWWRPGFSPIASGATGFCACTASDFDVDDFGRVFAPDTGRFRVGVLDANGNEIASIGEYGNQDCCGPDSYVLDPAGRFLRPRKADDPKEIASPSAKPEIGLAWVIGVAVTDRHAYVDDLINKRILRLRLGYAAEETVGVP